MPNSNDQPNQAGGRYYFGDKEYIKERVDRVGYEVKEIIATQKFYVECKPYPFPKDDDEENGVTMVDVDTKIYDQLDVYAEAEGLTTEELIISIIKEWLENVEVIDV